MSIKLSQLKQEEIKAKILVSTPEGDKEIVIRNPLGETKQEIVNYVRARKDEDDTYSTEIIMHLLNKLTNIDVDVEEIDAILDNPSTIMIEVMKHLNDIVQDIVFEIITEQTIALSMVEKSMASKELTNKIEKLNKMVEEAKTNLTAIEEK